MVLSRLKHTEWYFKFWFFVFLLFIFIWQQLLHYILSICITFSNQDGIPPPLKRQHTEGFKASMMETSSIKQWWQQQAGEVHFDQVLQLRQTEREKWGQKWRQWEIPRQWWQQQQHQPCGCPLLWAPPRTQPLCEWFWLSSSLLFLLQWRIPLQCRLQQVQLQLQQQGVGLICWGWLQWWVFEFVGHSRWRPSLPCVKICIKTTEWQTPGLRHG